MHKICAKHSTNSYYLNISNKSLSWRLLLDASITCTTLTVSSTYSIFTAFSNVKIWFCFTYSFFSNTISVFLSFHFFCLNFLKTTEGLAWQVLEGNLIWKKSLTFWRRATQQLTRQAIKYCQTRKFCWISKNQKTQLKNFYCKEYIKKTSWPSFSQNYFLKILLSKNYSKTVSTFYWHKMKLILFRLSKLRDNNFSSIFVLNDS